MIERPNFLNEWVLQVRQQPQTQGHGQRGSPATGQAQQRTMQPGTTATGGTDASGVHPKEPRHPLIKALADPVLEKYGPRYAIKKILDANNTLFDQLPTISKFVSRNGRSFLCWNQVLKGCTYHACMFRNMGGHADVKDYPPTFATSVCRMLQPGIDHLMAQETPANEARKKAKVADDTTPLAPAE